jgi:hypothetical protein
MKNWKSTIAGVIAGAIPILQQAYSAIALNQPVIWGLVAFGVAIMALGVVSKDFDKTGV